MSIKIIVQKSCQLFFAGILLTNTVYAESFSEKEQSESQNPKEQPQKESEDKIQRVPVGERALTKEQMDDFEAERAIKALEAEPLEEEHVSKPLYQTSHPGAFHNIYWLSSYEGKIELADRSVWNTQRDYNFSNWRKNDVIMISQSGHFHYPYCLTNQRTTEYVLANLYLGPDLSSYYRISIQAIYPENGYINMQLSDGSHWVMSSLDYYILTGWSIGDTVIIGINTDVWNAQGNNILINVSTNNRASGSCVAY